MDHIPILYDLYWNTYIYMINCEYIWDINNRRKFRSETSDNMDS